MDRTFRAAIDVGSNSLILTIAEISLNPFKLIRILEDKLFITGLGSGIDKEKIFSIHSMAETTKAFQQFLPLLDKWNIHPSKVICVATEASRVALNASEYFKNIQSQFGFNVRVISSDEEAHLTSLGVFFGMNENDRAKNHKMNILDIGGASTEIMQFDFHEQKILKSISFPAGTIRVFDWENLNIWEEKQKELLKLVKDEEEKIPRVTGVAATVIYIAAMIQTLTSFDEKKLQGSFFRQEQLIQLKSEIKNYSSEKLKEIYPFLGVRAKNIKSGVVWLEWLVNLYKIDVIDVSTFGLRHGALSIVS